MRPGRSLTSMRRLRRQLLGLGFALATTVAAAPAQEKFAPSAAAGKGALAQMEIPRFNPNETRDSETEETEVDHIETDRDSFTPATTTAGAGRLIIESAYSF